MKKTMAKVLAAVFTMCLMMCVGVMFYMYIKEPQHFKWVIGGFFLVIIPIVLYSVTDSFINDVFKDIDDKKAKQAATKQAPPPQTPAPQEQVDGAVREW